jgi:hypothetical protein
MAGSLIKIDEEIVTSAVASVTLGGANWDSSYDVYMVKFNNVAPSTDVVSFSVRFTVSGTPDTSANYDVAQKNIRTSTPFTNTSSTNITTLFLSRQLGTGTGEIANGIHYLFNFNNPSEYSFLTNEESIITSDAELLGKQGGGTLTVSQATDGVQYLVGSGNIVSGTFTLYGLKK